MIIGARVMLALASAGDIKILCAKRPDEGPTGPRRQDRGDTHGYQIRGLEGRTAQAGADSMVEARRRLVDYYEYTP